MKFITLSSLLLASVASVMGEVQKPTFERLFNGVITVKFDASVDMIVGPFGTRVQGGITGGNLTDPNTGKAVANIRPAIGGEVGLVTADGTFYPDVRLTAQWVEDKKLAYITLRGVGKLGVTDALYVQFETDSPKFSNLNDKFLISNATFPTPTSSFLDIGIFVLQGTF